MGSSKSLSRLKDFSGFGLDTQEMILSQLGAIELDRIGPKSIATVGKSLIRLISQSHQYQGESDSPEVQENWIAVREMSLDILESILAKFQELSEKAEIAEWDRSAVLNLLSDISKVCHDEQRRTDEQIRAGAGKELSDDLLNEILGI
jgi:hypothetical protein